MHRKTSEPSFIDILVPDHIGRNDQMIDWPKVAKQVNGLHSLYVVTWAGQTELPLVMRPQRAWSPRRAHSISPDSRPCS